MITKFDSLPLNSQRSRAVMLVLTHTRGIACAAMEEIAGGDKGTQLPCSIAAGLVTCRLCPGTRPRAPNQGLVLASTGDPVDRAHQPHHLPLQAPPYY
jgi:hypothetical protein